MRIRGSHHLYAKSHAPTRISVPIHGNTPLKTGLQRHFTRLADIDESELWVIPRGTGLLLTERAKCARTQHFPACIATSRCAGSPCRSPLNILGG